MKISIVPAALIALAMLSTGPALGQTPFELGVDPATSDFTWTGSTNQGALVGPDQSFWLEGSLSLEIRSDSQGLRTGRFAAAEIAFQPGLFGQFAGGAPGSFELIEAILTLVSDTFPIGSNGRFATTLAPSFLDGTLVLAPPNGPMSFNFLDGVSLDPVAVSGTLQPAGSALRLDVPLVLVFNFAAAAVSGSLTMEGELVAELGCPARSYCLSAPNSVGAGAVITTMGTPSVSENRLLLRASGLPPLQNGIFLYSASPTQTPFGDGVLCLAAPRFRLAIARSSAAGDAAHLLDLGSPPSLDGQIAAGEAWSFQFLYRDPAAGGASFNLSDAVRVFFCP